MIWLLVPFAGGLGAIARLLVDHAVAARLGRRLPWSTLAVNVTGSFAAGLLAGLAATGAVPDGQRLVAAVGFLGGYTTFSTYAVETLTLTEVGARLSAAAYAATSVLACVAAAAAGVALAGAG